MEPDYIMADTKLLLALTGLAWSGLLALSKRAINGLESKIDDNARKVTALQSAMATMVGDTKYRIERNFRDLMDETRTEIKQLSERLERSSDPENSNSEPVSRHEFHLFVTSISVKIDSIHNQLAENGAKEKNGQL